MSQFAPMEIASPPPIEVHDLTVSYDKKPVLWNIDVAIPEGQIVGIIGPNGAGKSTLIKAIMGLMPAESGWVKIYGEPLARQRRLVGYVPQRESVDWDFPVTVRDVVLMGTYGRLGLFRRPGQGRTRALRQIASNRWAWPPMATGRLPTCRGASGSACFWRGPWHKTAAST